MSLMSVIIVFVSVTCSMINHVEMYPNKLPRQYIQSYHEFGINNKGKEEKITPRHSQENIQKRIQSKIEDEESRRLFGIESKPPTLQHELSKPTFKSYKSGNNFSAHVKRDRRYIIFFTTLMNEKACPEGKTLYQGICRLIIHGTMS